jgi:hypothetical protein
VFGKLPTLTVVSAGVLAAAEEAAALLAGALLAGAVALGELVPEEQAASVAPRDMTHKVPARDLVHSFILWSFYRLVTEEKGQWSWSRSRESSCW